MSRRLRGRGLVSWLGLVGFLGGLLGLPVPAASAGVSTVSVKPVAPVGLNLPSTPIVSGAPGGVLGFLPGSGGVSATGQYSYTIPVEVPAGRGGEQPHLSLVYHSGAGNGVLGVGWSLSGLSVISRCGQSLSSEGVSAGVGFTDYSSSTKDAARDRFCLDGQKLVVVNGGGYGADGTEYRTESDQNLKVVSQASSSVAAAQGPDGFTVQSPDGSTSTYSGVSVTRFASTASGSASVGSVRAVWVLSSQQDVSGNGVVYNYNNTASTMDCPASALQVLLCSIDYTTFQGNASGALRHVVFTYEVRPNKVDQEFTWQSGVKTQLVDRLKTITMSAPNPAVSVPVWQYQVGYQSASSFSGRSLLGSVQRCAVVPAPAGSVDANGNPISVLVNDCTFAKMFSYTQGSAVPSFVAAKVPSATNIAIGNTMVANPGNAAVQYTDVLAGQSFDSGGPPPMLSVADVTGNGADDLLLQPGATGTWQNQLAAYAALPCDGDNYGVSSGAPGCPAAPANVGPLLLLGSHTTQTVSGAAPVSPLGQPFDLTSSTPVNDFAKLNSEFNTDASTGGVHNAAGRVAYPYYPNGWLENVVPFDPDGSGKASLLVNDLNNSACGRLLDYTSTSAAGTGFSDRGVNYAGCAPLPVRACCVPSHTGPDTPTGSFTGNGRPDAMASYPDTAPHPPGFPANPAVLQPLINIGGNQAASAPTSVASTISAGCPVYTGDFTGSGRSQLLGQVWDPVNQGCGQTALLSFDPFSGKALNDSFVQSTDTTGSLPDQRVGAPAVFPALGPCVTIWNPADCVDSNVQGNGGSVTPLGLYFGDFNGDGLTDVVIANPVSKTLSIRFNTGNGYGPAMPLGSPAWMNGAYTIKVADLNHDGRADLVVFHEVDAANQPQRAITMMLSNGDGSFNSQVLTPVGATVPADPGLRTYEGWRNQALGDFNGDGNVGIAVLVGDPATAMTDNDSRVFDTHATLWTLTQATDSASPPSNALQHQAQPVADLLATVSDSSNGTWNREEVSYASSTAPSGAPGWSDKPESTQCPGSALNQVVVQYPVRCVTSGLVTVRSVTSFDTTADSAIRAHTVFYSYEEPTADARGRGFLGFRKVRVWDPTRLQQTVTIYDNTSEAGTPLPPQGASTAPGLDSFVPSLFGPGFYQGSAQPLSVTTMTAIPSSSSPQTVPSFPTIKDANGNPVPAPGAVPVTVRVVQTVNNTRIVQTNGGKTFQVRPVAGSVPYLQPWVNAILVAGPASVTSTWEASASMAASVNDAADPTSENIWGPGFQYPMVAPASAAVRSSTVLASCDGNGINPGSGGGGCVDGFGNVTASVDASSTGSGATLLPGASTQTVATFNNLTTGSLYVIGRPATVTVTDSVADNTVSPVSRQTAFDYDTAGRLAHTYTCQQVNSTGSSAAPCVSTAVAAGSFTLVSTVANGYDQYGNVTSVATTAVGPDGQQDTRQVNIEYDPVFPAKSGQPAEPDERIFPSQAWVPNVYPGLTVGPSSWQAVQPAYGVTVASEDVNGVQSQATFDDQGRPLTVSPQGAASTSYSYAPRTDAVQTGVINGLTVTTTTGTASTVVSTDSAGRTLLTQSPGFAGGLVDVSTGYDSLGRAIKTSRPYVDGGTPQFFGTQVLDGLDRVLSSTTPDGKTTKNTYGFFNKHEFDAKQVAHQVSQVVTMDPVGNQSTVETDVDGNVIASGNLVPNPGSGTTVLQASAFHYLPFGLQDVARTPTGNTETTSYDTLGRITGTTSPDSGNTTGYVYDGFGELLSQTHQQSGAVTTYSYDPFLGRQTGWSTTDNSTITSSSYTFDSAAHGLGKLATAASSDGVSIAYGYNTNGQQASTTETVNGTAYTLGQTFDSQGRPDKLSYPAIGNNPNPGMILQDVYNPQEYLQTINYQTSNAGSTTGMFAQLGLWQITSRFPDGSLQAASTPITAQGVAVSYQQYPDSGRVKEITAIPHASPNSGLDLTYNYFDNGQVQSRTDTVNGRTDSYTYDSLNRLSTWALSTCTPGPCTAPANAANTRTSTYSYSADGNLLGVSVSPTLGATSAPTETNTFGPFGGSNGGPQGGPHALDTHTTPSGTTTYTYDTHGRMINGGGRSIAFNACNLPTSIANASGTWTMKYGPDCTLASKTGPDGTTIYIGDLYEHRTSPSGTQDVFYVPGVGQITVSGVHTNRGTLQYLTAQHITITDTQQSTGIIVDGLSGQLVGGPNFYDPFGARINPDGTPLTPTTPGDVAQANVTKGFTGQEDNNNAFGLDNYNGRFYDPILKRFISPDPVVSDPLSTQAWNPYSYVNNDPVNNTDPTGYSPNSNVYDAEYALRLAINDYAAAKTGSQAQQAAFKRITDAWQFAYELERGLPPALVKEATDAAREAATLEYASRPGVKVSEGVQEEVNELLIKRAVAAQQEMRAAAPVVQEVADAAEITKVTKGSRALAVLPWLGFAGKLLDAGGWAFQAGQWARWWFDQFARWSQPDFADPYAQPGVGDISGAPPAQPLDEQDHDGVPDGQDYNPVVPVPDFVCDADCAYGPDAPPPPQPAPQPVTPQPVQPPVDPPPAPADPLDGGVNVSAIDTPYDDSFFA